MQREQTLGMNLVYRTVFSDDGRLLTRIPINRIIAFKSRGNHAD